MIATNTTKQLDALVKDNPALEQSPYWERWSAGRPSKAKLEKRRLHHEWESNNRKENPHLIPMLSFLLKDESETEIKGKFVSYKRRNNT